MKEVEKIILVSDSVRGTGVSRREAPREKGRLLGGSLTLGDAARRLVEAGFDEERIMRAATVNPRAYLRGD
jgi:N-acetylglucosamine-6-phosphate deacetylase